MKIIVFDDIDAGVNLLKSLSDKDIETYCLPKSHYERPLRDRRTKTVDLNSVDEFFAEVIESKVWRAAPGGRGGTHTLNKLTQSDPILVLIHVNLKLSAFSNRLDQEGVELLKHIRLTALSGVLRNAHVILYSSEDTALELLKSKPQNMIILSKGVTVLPHWSLTEKLGELGYLATLAKDKADVSDEYLAAFVRCDFRPVDADHEFSNWWGLRQLALATSNITGKVHYPHSVKENLLKLQNKKACLLYDASAIAKDAPTRREPAFPRGEFSIVCIDDEKGWGELLANALHAHTKRRISVTAPPLPSSRAIDGEWIQSEILDRNPDLVMCDLRLYGASEGGKSFKEMSGAKVIQTIRKLDPGVPVILMTASNKAWTFEEAVKIGVDGYWMKEGIGEHMPPGGSAENYMKLLDLIAKAIGPGYQFLRRFSSAVAEVKGQTSPWWEDHKWPNGDVTHSDVDAVFNLLDGVLIVLREYLRLFDMGYGYKGESYAVQRSWVSSLVVEVSKVIELAHQLDKKAYTAGKSMAQITSARSDWWGSYLNDLRNKQAHAQEGTTVIEFAQVQKALSGVVAWLLEQPNGRTDNQFYGSLTYQRITGN